MMKAEPFTMPTFAVTSDSTEPPNAGFLEPQMPRTRLFDPFGDFDTRGYLQNAKAYKTASAVKRFEHSMHMRALPSAITALQTRDRLTYQDLLDTHRRLFGAVYPTWAAASVELVRRSEPERD